jgi:hypothetical protein
MFGTAEVGWYRDRHPELIAATLAGVEDAKKQGFYKGRVPDSRYFVYGPKQQAVDVRQEYLPEMLQVSDIGDAEVVLLNPVIRDERGEWEAWWEAPWLPGATRFRSFFELVQESCESLGM